MTTIKPRIVYIHGDHVLHWSQGWVRTLAQDLETADYETFFELFPDSIEARAKYWLPFLAEHVQAGEDDVLLGWSCGAVAAMRYAQDHRVSGLILIAPYYTDLGLEEVRRSGFVEPAWSWEKVRANTGRIAMFHSDADPFIGQPEFSELAKQLQADVHLIPGAGHFSDQDQFPQLTDYIFETYR
jgi:predicted alpha/beta hydrolase family esterase